MGFFNIKYNPGRIYSLISLIFVILGLAMIFVTLVTSLFLVSLSLIFFLIAFVLAIVATVKNDIGFGVLLISLSVLAVLSVLFLSLSSFFYRPTLILDSPLTESEKQQISVSINPEVKVGCRSPEEPGCEICLEKYEIDGYETRCSRFFSDRRYVPEDSPIYYSGSGVTPCDRDFPACAQCTENDELRLIESANDVKRNRCDCNNIEIGIDHCFGIPTSCGCYCSRMFGRMHTCPTQDFQ